jgi:hypothetical protein
MRHTRTDTIRACQCATPADIVMRDRSWSDCRFQVAPGPILSAHPPCPMRALGRYFFR